MGLLGTAILVYCTQTMEKEGKDKTEIRCQFVHRKNERAKREAWMEVDIGPRIPSRVPWYKNRIKSGLSHIPVAAQSFVVEGQSITAIPCKAHLYGTSRQSPSPNSPTQGQLQLETSRRNLWLHRLAITTAQNPVRLANHLLPPPHLGSTGAGGAPLCTLGTVMTALKIVDE